MSENTKIKWADDTFNPWWGCCKVGPGCERCYAETLANRFFKGLWGTDAPRRIASEATWAEPLAWERKSAATGEPRCILCPSMCDVFEDRRDLDAPRERLFDLIQRTPHLTWGLLTKRSQHMVCLAPAGWREGWPSNVWALATTEN